MNPVDPGLDFHLPPDLVRGPVHFGKLSAASNWGIDLFKIPVLRDAVSKAARRPIAVLDTGCDHSHPELRGSIISSKDWTGSPVGAGDRDGHGTHTFGTCCSNNPLIGVGPGWPGLVGKVLNDNGSGAGSWIAAGIRWAAENGAKVISMSLGSSGPDSQILAAMEEVSKQHNVWCIAAAGNSGGGTPDVDWPARSEYCISVAALDEALRPANFTNRGEKIDTAWAGVNIISTRPGGGHQSMSGTSMATPGGAQTINEYRCGLEDAGRPIPSVIDLRAELHLMSVDTHTPGDDLRTGPGWFGGVMAVIGLNRDPKPIGG